MGSCGKAHLDTELLEARIRTERIEFQVDLEKNQPVRAVGVCLFPPVHGRQPPLPICRSLLELGDSLTIMVFLLVRLTKDDVSQREVRVYLKRIGQLFGGLIIFDAPYKAARRS